MKFSAYKEPCPIGVRLPEIKIEAERYRALGVEEGISNYDFLRHLCFEGVKDKGIDKQDNSETYYNRVKYELSILKDLDFVDYILLNWDVLNYCEKNSIPTGVGRGSAAGSLINYLVGITKVDPIRYGLFFERFVSKSRAKKTEKDGITYLDGSLLCDIDNDIAYDRRSEVIDYINKKYPARTCKILTVNTLSSKLCAREVFKLVAGMSEEEVNFISDKIPKLYGKPAKIKEAFGDDGESEYLQDLRSKEPEAYKIALKIEGLNKNVGVHPSGIAISHDELCDIMPLQKTKDGNIVSGYSMDDVSELAVKFDILGLRTLSVIDGCEKALGIDVREIDAEDKFIFDNLQDIKLTAGLFQLEAHTNSRVCKDVSPRDLEELSAVVALARPGAIDFLEDFIEYRYSGKAQNIHPHFDEILAYTGGIPLYQEQLMQMAVSIGFSLDESEQLRRIIGKKKVDEIPKWESKIDAKIVENNLEAEVGEILWKVAEDSANYSFNKSHAVCYAITAAWTAYLKFNYPQQFFLQLLRQAGNEPNPFEEISRISQELKHFQIKLLPPDLSRSAADFTIEKNSIRYGLKSVKGVSNKVISSLLEFRGQTANNKYEVFLAAKSAGLNIGVLSALIQAGTLESFGGNRSRLVLEAQTFNLLTDREKRLIISAGKKFNYDVLSAIHSFLTNKTKDDKGKEIISEKRFQTISKKYEKYRTIYELNMSNEFLANWYFEKQILGYSYSQRLEDILSGGVGMVKSIDLDGLPDQSSVKMAGWVSEYTKRTSAAGNRYLRIQMEDEFGQTNLMCMERNLDINDLTGKLNSDSIVVAVGKKTQDTVFVNSLKIFDEKIYMKLSDVK